MLSVGSTFNRRDFVPPVYLAPCGERHRHARAGSALVPYSSMLTTLDKALYQNNHDDDLPLAASLIGRIRQSGYSGWGQIDLTAQPVNQPYALLVDQRLDDPSVAAAGADAQHFREMAERAVSVFGEDGAFVIRPPNDHADHSNWHLAKLIKARKLRLARNTPFRSLHDATVHSVSDPFAFDCAVLGLQVSMFGMPTFAGRGFTKDCIKSPTDRPNATLEQYFAQWILRQGQFHRLDGTSATFEALLDALDAHYQTCGRLRAWSPMMPANFQAWKTCQLKHYLNPAPEVTLFTSVPTPPRQVTPIVWASRKYRVPTHAACVWMEDGFLRSAGLGSDFIEPQSIVFDQRGIYYETQRETDLSAMLNQMNVSAALISRAAALRQAIVASEITKYNFKPTVPSWSAPHGKSAVLVVGQVPNDASLRSGSQFVTNDQALLREVRKLRSNAFIVYRPHPDVVSKNRSPFSSTPSRTWGYDAIDSTSDIISSIKRCDEVHVITSLAGFDALLRGKRVVCHGRPFYAGWGLTEDRSQPTPFRQRTRTLDELVAISLILYPIYWDSRNKLFCSPETVVKRLVDARQNMSMPVFPMNQWVRGLRWLRLSALGLAERYGFVR
jgi:capsular polysaccharide export protein